MRAMHVKTLTILALVFVAMFQPASAAPNQGCDELDDYARALQQTISLDDRERLESLMDRGIENLRPSQLAEASELLDAWASEIEDMPESDVPLIARDYHEALIDNISILSSALNSMATMGVFGAVAYVDAIDAATLNMEAATAKGERACGADWPFEN